jgi:hypothetical protein
VPILSFFLLKDAASFEQNLVALLPNERLQRRAHWLLMDVSRTLAAYIRAQITACLVVGSVMMIGLTLIGAPYPVVMGQSGVVRIHPACRSVDFGGRHLRFDADGVGEDRTDGRTVSRGSPVGSRLLHLSEDSRTRNQDAPVVVVIAILAGAEIGGLIGIFLSIPVVGLVIVFYNTTLRFGEYRVYGSLPIRTTLKWKRNSPACQPRTGSREVVH